TKMISMIVPTDIAFSNFDRSQSPATGTVSSAGLIPFQRLAPPQVSFLNPVAGYAATVSDDGGGDGRRFSVFSFSTPCAQDVALTCAPAFSPLSLASPPWLRRAWTAKPLRRRLRPQQSRPRWRFFVSGRRLILPPRQSCVGFSEQSFFWPWMFPKGESSTALANAATGVFVPPNSATFDRRRAFSPQQKENIAMAKKEAKKLDELFHDTLKDIYFAEKKILATLPKMEKAAQAPELKRAFAKHKTETEGHVARLEKVFAAIDKKPQGKTCDAIVGITEEGAEIMKEYKGSPAL